MRGGCETKCDPSGPQSSSAESGLAKCSRWCQFCCHKAEPCCRQQTDSREMVPSQREGLVYAVVVDQLYLESPIRVQWQPTSREHQVDLELVGWEGEEI